VKDAVLALYSDEKVHVFGWLIDAPTVAAALRAVARNCEFADVSVNETVAVVRVDTLLAIAAELEGGR
jgi:hypothetical protein